MAEEDVFASSFGRRQDEGKSLLLTHSLQARFRWWDGTPSPRRARRGSDLTQRPTPRPRHHLQPVCPRHCAHAWNRPSLENGPSPTAHFATRQAPSSSRYSRVMARRSGRVAPLGLPPQPLTALPRRVNRPLLPPEPSEAPPTALPLMPPRWSLMSRLRADPAQSAGREPLPPAS